MNANKTLKYDFRWLNPSPSDEQQLINLLKEVYSLSYSYQELYQPGKITNLLEAEKVKSLGIFKEEKLYGHTALLIKDIKNEYVESGMSFKNNSKENISREREFAATSFLYDYVNENHFFMHQNTTTYHPFAQAYARKAFKAKAVGFIFEYAVNEELTKIAHHEKPMNALVMTSVLNKAKNLNKKIVLPNNSWGEWIRFILAKLELNREIEWIDCNKSMNSTLFKLTEIEYNSSLNLKRMNLQAYQGRELATSLHKSFDQARVKLVHLKMNKRDIEQNFKALMDQHFYPVAIRPHQERDDEIIFQKFNVKLDTVINDLKESRIYNNEDWAILEQWMQIAQELL